MELRWESDIGIGNRELLSKQKSAMKLELRVITAEQIITGFCKPQLRRETKLGSMLTMTHQRGGDLPKFSGRNNEIDTGCGSSGLQGFELRTLHDVLSFSCILTAERDSAHSGVSVVIGQGCLWGLQNGNGTHGRAWKESVTTAY